MLIMINLGLICFIFAISYIPTILLSSRKFAFFYIVSNILAFCSILFLKSPKSLFFSIFPFLNPANINYNNNNNNNENEEENSSSIGRFGRFLKKYFNWLSNPQGAVTLQQSAIRWFFFLSLWWLWFFIMFFDFKIWIIFDMVFVDNSGDLGSFPWMDILYWIIACCGSFCSSVFLYFFICTVFW